MRSIQCKEKLYDSSKVILFKRVTYWGKDWEKDYTGPAIVVKGQSFCFRPIKRKRIKRAIRLLKIFFKGD